MAHVAVLRNQHTGSNYSGVEMWLPRSIFGLFIALALSFSLPCDAVISARVSMTQLSGAEKMPCPVYWWAPPQESPKALIVLLHGFAMHGQAYERLATRLAEDGFGVAAIDMRGYGARQSALGADAGQSKVDYRQSRRDYEQLISLLRQEFPGRKVFLIGESLGAAMAIRITIDLNENEVDGVILSSPAVRLKKRVALRNLPCAVAHSTLLLGPVNLSNCISKVVAYDPKIRTEARDDLLIRRKYRGSEIWRTLRFMRETIKLAKFVPARTPAYCIEASTDTLLSEKGSFEMFRKLGSDNKCLQVFEDDRHVLLETRYLRDDVFKAICHWLNDRMQDEGGIAAAGNA